MIVHDAPPARKDVVATTIPGPVARVATSIAAVKEQWVLREFHEATTPGASLPLPWPESLIGRGATASVRIADASVSKNHARMFFSGGSLFVTDLSSTNGTYVNGRRIEHSALIDGDLLQLGGAIFQVRHQSPRPVETDNCTVSGDLQQWSQTLVLFNDLIGSRSVVPHYQPIVPMLSGQVGEQTPAAVGWELLARSGIEQLANPAAMFGAAERLGQQATLSELMRSVGTEVAAGGGLGHSRIFYNTHPEELGTVRLDDSLVSLRSAYPEQPITIEVHEAAVARIDQMRRFRDQLTALDMQLAYDDFGAGQGRLLELTEVPADVLKFDMSLIRGIDTASSSRQSLVRSLIAVAIEAGSIPLAEGVETIGEHECCCELGFQLGQGFFYGRPRPIDALGS